MARVCTVQKRSQQPDYEVRDIKYVEPGLALTEREAERQANKLVEAFIVPMETSALKSRCNRPDAVRKEFLNYLRTGFGYQRDFKHPTLDEVFSNALIHQKLHDLKNYFALKHSSRLTPAAGHQSSSQEVCLVRTAFLNYLKVSFPTGQPWQNPVSGRVYANQQIRSVLNHYKEAYDGISTLYYKSLWCLFTTQASRSFIAANFDFSDNSVLRLWYDAVDGIMLLLEYQDLNPNFNGRYHENYHALWCLISTRTTRSQASEYFNLSDSSIKRLWNDLIDPLLLTLAYPELSVEKAMAMYKNRG